MKIPIVTKNKITGQYEILTPVGNCYIATENKIIKGCEVASPNMGEIFRLRMKSMVKEMINDKFSDEISYEDLPNIIKIQIL